MTSNGLEVSTTLTNNDWLWKDVEAYRSDLYGRGERTMLLEIATSLHEIAQQLAEANGHVGPAPVLTESPMAAVHTAAPVTGQSFIDDCEVAK